MFGGRVAIVLAVLSLLGFVWMSSYKKDVNQKLAMMETQIEEVKQDILHKGEQVGYLLGYLRSIRTLMTPVEPTLDRVSQFVDLMQTDAVKTFGKVAFSISGQQQGSVNAGDLQQLPGVSFVPFSITVEATYLNFKDLGAFLDRLVADADAVITSVSCKGGTCGVVGFVVTKQDNRVVLAQPSAY